LTTSKIVYNILKKKGSVATLPFKTYFHKKNKGVIITLDLTRIKIMNKLITTTLLLCLSLYGVTQDSMENKILENLIELGEVSNGNRDFAGYDKLDSLFNGVEIVMLGEQSHGDGTTFDTKIKLIQYLHEKQGFDILAFEAGFYDCNKAWLSIVNGGPADIAMGKSIITLWSNSKQFIPLSNYIDSCVLTGHPLQLMGFDIQFTGLLWEENYAVDLSNYLRNIDSSIINSESYNQLVLDINSVTNFTYKELKKKNILQDTILINQLLSSVNSSLLYDSFWHQSLISLKYYLIEAAFKKDYRDQRMADNLIWIKDNYPNRKIICWGATSHFLYNSQEIEMLKFPFSILDNYYKKVPSMGTYIKNEYKDKVMTIGFTAYEGEARAIKEIKKLKPVLEGSLEQIIGMSEYENCLLPLNNINVDGLLSRPLAYQYMKTNIQHVMDAVIFNRTMTPNMGNQPLIKILYPDSE
jgi:erythromycin esterase